MSLIVFAYLPKSIFTVISNCLNSIILSFSQFKCWGTCKNDHLWANFIAFYTQYDSRLQFWPPDSIWLMFWPNSHIYLFVSLETVMLLSTWYLFIQARLLHFYCLLLAPFRTVVKISTGIRLLFHANNKAPSNELIKSI